MTSPTRDNEDTCPACPTESQETSTILTDKESWIRCDACKTWFHWRCVGAGEDLSTIDKWYVSKWQGWLYTDYCFRYCQPCRAFDASRSITHKPPARKSARKKQILDYANLHTGTPPGTSSKWVDVMDKKHIVKESFKRMKGEQVSREWIENDNYSMQEPVVIENPEGLGMKMPSDEITVARIADLLGVDTPVEVIGEYYS